MIDVCQHAHAGIKIRSKISDTDSWDDCTVASWNLVLSTRCKRRAIAHHRNSDLAGLSLRRFDDIHSAMSLMHLMTLARTACRRNTTGCRQRSSDVVSQGHG